MDVLIVGAGIAGLAAARAAMNAGHTVRVLEASPRLRTGGGAVTVFSNGFAALAALGVDATGLGAQVRQMRFRTATNTRLAEVDLTPWERRTGFPVRCVPRGVLLGALADALPAHAIRFDTRIVFGHTVDRTTHLVDSRGIHHEADLVVGADGHRSVIRRLFLDRAPARDVGWVTWQGLGAVLPRIADSAVGVYRVGRAGFAGFMPAGDGLTLWWFDMPARELPDSRPAVALLRHRFGGYPEPVGDLWDQIRDEDIMVFRHLAHRIPRRWGAGPVTLVGDAAHVFPPTQAQGANQALEDAYVLGRTLADGSATEVALRAYEAARARRVRRVSRLATTEATNKLPALPARVVQAAIPPALAGRGYLALVTSWSSVLRHTAASP